VNTTLRVTILSILFIHTADNQELKFVVVDCTNASRSVQKQTFLGELNVHTSDLVQIIGRKSLHRPLTHPFNQDNRGSITLRATQVENTADIVHLEISAMNLDSKDTVLFVDNTSPFLVIKRHVQETIYETIYTSEVIKGTMNVPFRTIELSMYQLCYGDRSKRFRIECWSHKKNLQHDLIGALETSLETLQKNVLNATMYPLINEKLKAELSDYKNSGSLCVQSVMVEKRPSFLDYILGDTLLSLSIGVDFSKYNETNQLHEHNDDLSVYQKCILETTEMMDIYTDQKYHMYGFGGQLPNHEKSSQCFPLNFNSDSRIKCVEDFQTAYEKCVSVVKMHEPAYFSPLIHTCAANTTKFQILMILTSCVCDDLEDVEQEISQLDGVPMYVVIIGLGSGDLSRLETLNRFRNVKFVKHEENSFIQRAFGDIPRHFLAYMRRNNTIPQSPRKKEVQDTDEAIVQDKYVMIHPPTQVNAADLPYSI
jgi:hypothetical protein